MPGTERSHQVLAGQLAQPVDAHRTGRVGLRVRRAALLVEPEHIIRAEVNQGAI